MNPLKNSVGLRRVPKQKRSREKYERILEAARVLIAERGNDAVSMREIAEASEVVIGTVYQYFPDKNAVLWTLLSVHFDRLEEKWLSELDSVFCVDQLNHLSLALFDDFVDICLSDPSFSRLWRCVQGNTVLQELDREFNERIADTYTNKLESLGVKQDKDRVWIVTFLMASLSSTALQLAFADESRQDALLGEFRNMLRYSFSMSQR